MNSCQNIFRISTNPRKRNQHNRQSNSISLAINSSVLKQYRSIDLNTKILKNRIRHKSTLSVLASIAKDNSQVRSIENWQKSIEKLLQAKQKIQSKKQSINSAFKFHKLDKLNSKRYKRLIKQQFLHPQQIQNQHLGDYETDNLQNSSILKSTRNLLHQDTNLEGNHINLKIWNSGQLKSNEFGICNKSKIEKFYNKDTKYGSKMRGFQKKMKFQNSLIMSILTKSPFN